MVSLIGANTEAEYRQTWDEYQLLSGFADAGTFDLLCSS